MKYHETIEHSSFDATISALDAETSVLGVAMSAIAQSFRQYPCGVRGDCGVGVTPQMCNRVANHGDMGTFSRPASQQNPNITRNMSTRMENWNQDLPERYSKFHGLYIKFQVHGKGRVIGTAPPVIGSGGKHVLILANKY